MAQALPDVSNEIATNGTTTIKNEEACRGARKAGWVEPEAYDYNAAAAPPGAQAVQDPNEEAPAWAHNASKYEWQEEYGDVGPRIQELEEELFRSEFLNRRGIKFEE